MGEGSTNWSEFCMCPRLVAAFMHFLSLWLTVDCLNGSFLKIGFQFDSHADLMVFLPQPLKGCVCATAPACPVTVSFNEDKLNF